MQRKTLDERIHAASVEFSQLHQAVARGITSDNYAKLETALIKARNIWQTLAKEATDVRRDNLAEEAKRHVDFCSKNLEEIAKIAIEKKEKAASIEFNGNHPI